MQANVEALTSSENKDYNNARAQYCALPVGKEGCVSAALRHCPLSIFCIR